MRKWLLRVKGRVCRRARRKADDKESLHCMSIPGTIRKTSGRSRSRSGFYSEWYIIQASHCRTGTVCMRLDGRDAAGIGHIHRYIQTFIHTCMQTQYTQTYCVCVHVCMYVSVCIYTHTHTHIYLCTYVTPSSISICSHAGI